MAAENAGGIGEIALLTGFGLRRITYRKFVFIRHGGPHSRRWAGMVMRGVINNDGWWKFHL